MSPQSDDLTAQYVLATLPRGRDNARSLSDLAESLHLLRRSVEQGVLDLRLEGWPVCSDGTGIWLGSAQDLDRTIASLQRRIVAQVVTLRALRATRKRMLPIVQTTLPWSGDRVA